MHWIVGTIAVVALILIYVFMFTHPSTGPPDLGPGPGACVPNVTC